MNILIIGDVVGQSGCDFVQKHLGNLKRKYNIDFTIANGENSAEGNGILPKSADQLWNAGVDVITLGNHGLRRREIYSYLDERDEIIRPVNFHKSAPGKGVTVYDYPGKPKVAVINLHGIQYMTSAYSNPFDDVLDVLEKIDANIIIVDFHAEATSEKLAMGFMLDGKISALVGTHTHIQTNDHRILPGGTGYITDIGMCGSFNSVLGVKPELALARFTTNLPVRFENDKGFCRLSGVVLEIDDKTGKTTKITPINVE